MKHLSVVLLALVLCASASAAQPQGQPVMIVPATITVGQDGSTTVTIAPADIAPVVAAAQAQADNRFKAEVAKLTARGITEPAEVSGATKLIQSQCNDMRDAAVAQIRQNSIEAALRKPK